MILLPSQNQPMKMPSANQGHEAVSREPLLTPDTPSTGEWGSQAAMVFLGNRGLQAGWSAAMLFVSLFSFLFSRPRRPHSGAGDHQVPALDP